MLECNIVLSPSSIEYITQTRIDGGSVFYGTAMSKFMQVEIGDFLFFENGESGIACEISFSGDGAEVLLNGPAGKISVDAEQIRGYVSSGMYILVDSSIEFPSVELELA